jgi:hypothetical protein
VAVGYARASLGLAQVARLADRLPWYLRRQPMYSPSFPGQLSQVLSHHPHPPTPHLPPVHLTPLYCHRPFPYPHHHLNQRRPARPDHPPCAYLHQDEVLSQIRSLATR